MPAPVITIPVQETSAGRRIFKDEAETEFNRAYAELFNLIAAIPAGPQGERGPAGAQGLAWIVGSVREFAEGLDCVVGNAIFRRYPGSNMTALFRCLQNTTTNISNFPATPVSNAAWNLVLIVPWGERGLQGVQGIQGIQGIQGESAEIIEFATDVAAQAYSASHPLALVISTEGA